MICTSCALSQWYEGDSLGQGTNYPVTGDERESSYPTNTNEQNYGGTQYYTSDPPSEAETLVDLGLAEGTSQSECPPGTYCYVSGGQSKCTAWITDLNGLQKAMTLSIPINKWARMEFLTCANGNLIVYEMDPSGIVLSYDFGPASANHKYLKWFLADSLGTHMIWFTIGGQKSNSITFDVVGSSGGSGQGGCSLMTSKSTYGVGESIIYRYTVPAATTATLKVYLPDGNVVQYGPAWLNPNTIQEQIGQASYPEGQRKVVLETGIGCRIVKYYSVKGLPSGYKQQGYDEQISQQGYDEQIPQQGYDGQTPQQGSEWYS